MPQTYFTETPDTEMRFQCRHIFTDGHRCESPALRNENFCYYHHTTRRPIQNPQERKARTSTFALPNPEDRSAIQHCIGEVLQRIAANEIDPRRAGLLLYGLQIASLNLPKLKPSANPLQTVLEIVEDPQHGPLASVCEFGRSEESIGPAELMLRELEREFPSDPILPSIHAAADAIPTPPQYKMNHGRGHLLARALPPVVWSTLERTTPQVRRDPRRPVGR